jgi:hypothetical protein
MASLLTYSAMAFGPKTLLPKYSEICFIFDGDFTPAKLVYLPLI